MTKPEVVKKYISSNFTSCIKMHLYEGKQAAYHATVMPQNEQNKNIIIISIATFFVHFEITDSELLRVKNGEVLRKDWYTEWL